MAQVSPGRPPTPTPLRGFDQRMALPLVAAAVLPLFLLPGGNYPFVGALVFIVSWLVFLVDLIVHVRHLVHYLRTWLGRFDLLVVVLTAPWFLFFGPNESKFVLLIRLARCRTCRHGDERRAPLVRTTWPGCAARSGRRVSRRGGGVSRRTPDQLRLRHIRRCALVGGGDLDDGRLRRHRSAVRPPVASTA